MGLRASVVIAVVCVIAGVTLPVDAQTPPTTSPNTTTATPTSGNETTPPSFYETSNGTTNASTNATGAPAFEGACRGLGTVSGHMCNGVLGALKGIARGFLDFARGVAEWAVEFLVSRPVPLRNGTPEFVDRPTNAPMDTVYDWWRTRGLPAGLLIWAFSMILLRANALMPTGAISNQQAKTLEAKGWFMLFVILGSWIWAAFVLHLASALTVTFAPSGNQIVASFETLTDSVLAGGLGALLLWLSSGILFLFVALVFGLSWLAVYVLVPALPVFLALSLPAFWLFRPLASVGDRLRGLFIPCAFVPFPAAVILGVGYPVTNAVHGSLDQGLSNAAGVDAFAYIILVLVMWFCAAVSPLFLFVGSRRMRPFATLAAGAIGAASGMAAANTSSNLRQRVRSRLPTGESATGSSIPANAGANTRVDPVDGSPFSRTNPGGFGGALDGETVAGELEGSTQRPTADQPALAAESTSTGEATSRATRSGNETTNSYAESVPDDVTYRRVQRRSELSKEQYDAGYFDSQGEFKSLSQGPSDTGWLLDKGTVERFISSKPQESVLLYDEASSAAYDIRNVMAENGYKSTQYYKNHHDSLDLVQATRR
ncbi:hypothetical protein DMJ13_05115 [halophilic archaeon]|nr:hypothetical protein DMJ13_05115 [halophilic archaeon]